MIEGKNILITGGAGFIGSTLVGELVEKNRISVYDNLTRNALRDKPFADHCNLEIWESDVTDWDDLNFATMSIDIVVHCAAIAGIDTTMKDPVRTMQVNMIGTANVLEAAHRRNVERVVVFSTSEIFGQRAFLASEQDDAWIGAVGEARWAYAVSKLAGEHLAMAYYRKHGLPVTILRPFNVYGPGQVGEGAIRTFVLKALSGEPLEVHGDGTQIRAWCYIDDCVRATLSAMEKQSAIGESFNIGNKRSATIIYGLANTVVRVLESSSPVVFSGKFFADVELRIPNVDKAERLLGFEAKVGLEEGIKKTAEYFLSGQKGERR